MLDLRQTPQYSKYMNNIGWITEGKPGSFAYIKKFPLIGSFIKIQRPQQFNDKTMEQLIKKYRTFQIVFEPILSTNIGAAVSHNQLILQGYKQSKYPFLPSKTIHIDLTKSEKELLKEMHYKTRYNIKKAKSLKLKTKSSKDIEKFANFWQRCAIKQRGMYLSQKKEIIELNSAFGKKAHIIKCLKDNILLSGILLIQTKDIAYYMYAASSGLGKKLFAPTLNVWEAIKLAKKLQCKIFDFEGIYDERFPLKTWLGFTRFKKSFGGEEIEYPGTFVKYRFPI